MGITCRQVIVGDLVHVFLCVAILAVFMLSKQDLSESMGKRGGRNEQYLYRICVIHAALCTE